MRAGHCKRVKCAAESEGQWLLMAQTRDCCVQRATFQVAVRIRSVVEGLLQAIKRKPMWTWFWSCTNSAHSDRQSNAAQTIIKYYRLREHAIIVLQPCSGTIIQLSISPGWNFQNVMVMLKILSIWYLHKYAKRHFWKTNSNTHLNSNELRQAWRVWSDAARGK
jgi:hypothetical protein